MKNKKKKYMSDIILDVVVYVVLILVLIVTAYPMWYVLVASITSTSELMMNPGIFLWPKKPIFGAYVKVFQDPLIVSGFLNTFKILALSLPLNMLLTVMCGYFMAGKSCMLKKPILAMIMFTMFFSGGMIPSYLNIKSLGLYDTVWALVLPGAVSVYNAIICKTAIEAIPESLSESAYIDGATDWKIMTRIVVPLIKPTMAVLLLYYGVAHWNSWFSASIYLKRNEDLPIQNILRAILLMNSMVAGAEGDVYNAYAESIKYAAIVVSTAPILCIYPFLQKYFVKGVMIGAVKG